MRQGTQNFGGIRVGNGPTEDEAEIIQHDQLSQHSEEEPEVKETLVTADQQFGEGGRGAIGST